jgi:putative transcriptional regulator
MMTQDSLPPSLQDIPLFFGGPVHSDHVMLVRLLADPASPSFRCEINPDPELLPESGCQLRACMGYAGWAAGQLEEEVAREDWTWIPADQALLGNQTGVMTWELVSSGDLRWQRLRSHLRANPERN